MITREFDVRQIELQRLKKMYDIKDICKKAGVSFEAWQTLMKFRGRKTKTRTIVRILKALDLPIESVIIFLDNLPNEPRPGKEVDP
ncbi:MAG: hypothetical protein QY316_03725 [Thermodesulfobacteriota bacterium]|nr:MAG: hypothetical protein QY316_03725 [Thermodesulfobacteriota bacterium]